MPIPLSPAAPITLETHVPWPKSSPVLVSFPTMSQPGITWVRSASGASPVSTTAITMLGVAGGQLPEIRGARQLGAPFVAPDRIVRLGHVARACRRRSERRQSPEQAEENHCKGAPHVGQCTGAFAGLDRPEIGAPPAGPAARLQTGSGQWARGRVFPWKPYPFATLSPGAGKFIKVDAPALISAAGALKTKGGGLKNAEAEVVIEHVF